jgi:hypothetical protein
MTETDQSPISPARFLAGLKALGYTPHNAEQLIGLSRTTLFRIARGTAPVPMVALKLLDMYERFGIPEEHKET